MRSGWVLQGPEVAAFETEFAAIVGAPHAVATSSGTSALILALRAVGVGPGDEVVTVSHSFIATANAITLLGARPVFVDVAADTFGMEAAAVVPAITARTKAILCVHQIGFPCDIEGLVALSEKRGVSMVEDAACALGTEVEIADRWEKIGKPHGRIACFSFHPRKIVTTGDGGMATTNDRALADKMRLARQHAMTVPPELRDKDPFAAEAFMEPAYNFRLTDLQAAIVRPQLRRLGASLAERKRLAAAFIAALDGHPVLAPPMPRGNARPNWQSFPTRVRPSSKRTVDELLRWFQDRGISCRRGLTNAHREPAYQGKGNFTAGPLPVSEELRRATLMLPLFQGMTRDEETAVVAAIAELR